MTQYERMDNELGAKDDEIAKLKLRCLELESRLIKAEKEALSLRVDIAVLREKANRTMRAYLCNQGIPEVDATAEANREHPLANDQGETRGPKA